MVDVQMGSMTGMAVATGNWLGTVADPKGTGWAVELDHS